MENRSVNMQALFSRLSEKNKDILILVAKSMEAAQEASAKRMQNL